MTDELTHHDAVDRLEELARERWGERWTISLTYWSDSDYQIYASRSRGQVDPDSDEQVIERERLWLHADENEVVLERVHVRDEQVTHHEILDREPLDADRES